MTSKSQLPSDPTSTESELVNAPPLEGDTPGVNAQTISFGDRLLAARKARGLDLETCAQTLKLPARVLRQLERDEYDGIDSKIYLASYISKYGRFVGINDASIDVEVDRIRQHEPTLVATGGISHSRFLLDRYATAATYAILTVVIVVPMVWLGVRGTLDRDLSHLAPLDATPVAQHDLPPVEASSQPTSLTAPATNQAVAPKPIVTSDQALMASMAPFPGLDTPGLSTPPAVTTSAHIAGSGSHRMVLNLTAASWVEVIDRDGKRLEYGLLPAGSNRTYRSDQPLDVRIGNASGAAISIDDQDVGLEEFKRSNVARFRMQIENGRAAAASL